jgi:hypothetical protein
MMRELGRRGFLVLAALSCAAPAAAQPRTAIDVEAFLALSRRLTGRRTLDRQLAQTYLSALLTQPGNADRLRELARRERADSDRRAALADLEHEIVEAWYTGTCRINGTPQLVTHSGALKWTALSRPAPGVCASAPGGWAKPR